METRKCAECGSQGNASTSLLRCSRCKTVHYCSRQCQQCHWPRHRSQCSSGSSVPVGSAAATSNSSSSITTTTTTATTSSTTTTAGSSVAWSRLFGTLYTDPWQRARSRSESAFPGVTISDDLGHLDLISFEINMYTMPFGGFMPFMPFMPMPFLLLPKTIHGKCGVVVLVKLVAPAGDRNVRGWVVQDKNGTQTHVVMTTEVASLVAPNVRFDELQQGQILVLRQPVLALVEIMGTKMHMLIVEDLNDVRVLRD